MKRYNILSTIARKYRRFKDFLLIMPTKLKYGWTPSDCWNLDYFLTNIVIETLTYFSKETVSYPGTYKSFEDWNAELQSIITAFIDYKEYNTKSAKRFRDAFPLFPEYKNDDYTTYLDNENKTFEDIKTRMRKLIDVWPDLWM